MKLKAALHISFSIMLTCYFATVALAQTNDIKRNACEPNWGARHCEVREQRFNLLGTALAVDSSGSISVRGWDQNYMVMKARVLVWSNDSAEEAREIAGRTRIEYMNGALGAVSADDQEAKRTSVSYELYVPRHLDLRLKAFNGGVTLSGLESSTELDINNGSITLSQMAGRVHGGTHNGSITIVLGGSAWQGAGVDVQTTNGGVTFAVPENYSARLETHTNWGRINIDYPSISQPPYGKKNSNGENLSLDLGAGGATLRAVTTNGNVTISRRTAT